MIKIAKNIFTWMKKELTITLYLVGISFTFITIKMEHIVNHQMLSLLIFITIFFCVVALGLDFQVFLNKLNKYKENIFVLLFVKIFKYALLCFVTFIVIKTANFMIYDLFGENPKNYPATLASLTIIITPLIWISILITCVSIISIILPVILAVFLPLLSIVSTNSNNAKFSFWKIFFRIIIILFASIIVSGFAQGMSKYIFNYGDKLVSIVILGTAFYKNNTTCRNLQNNDLIAFTDLREEVILYLETKDNQIKSKRTECTR